MISCSRGSISVSEIQKKDLKKKGISKRIMLHATRISLLMTDHRGRYTEKELMKTNERILVERSKEVCKSLGLIKFARICSMI